MNGEMDINTSTVLGVR